MIWQDLVLTFGGFVLAAGLVPLLRASAKPPVRSSLTMAAVLTAYIVAVGTLGLYLSAASLALQAGLWYVLAGQGFLGPGVPGEVHIATEGIDCYSPDYETRDYSRDRREVTCLSCLHNILDLQSA